jgi:ubiquinol-cytochrome c reductase cytochrome b subunit
VETGIIRQLPNGQYIEVTRPLPEQDRAVLEYNRVGAPQLTELQPGEDADGVPAPGTAGAVGRLRLALNRVLTEGIPIEGDGHGNGHGNGGHAAPAAVTAGEPGEQGAQSARPGQDGEDSGH